MSSFRTTRVSAGLVAMLAIVCLAVTGTAAAQEEAPKPAVQTAPHGAYAGTAACLTCHEALAAATTKGPHSHAFRAGTPMSPKGCQECHGDAKAELGCEACHGPGKDHAEAGGDKTKIRLFKSLSVKEASDTCVSCHFRTNHTFWAGSQHDERKVGCTSCHSIHAPAGDSQLKAATQTALCAQCHRTIVNKQYKFNHMPVREGKMECSSCHNVHGSRNVKLLKEGGTVNESCVSCHGEKRGPHLWEHPPVTESCSTCHDPHGSNNDRMLIAKQPFLCQRCHVTSRHPPTVYEGYLLNNSQNANKIYGRSCVVCHQQVHGSNGPNGKALLR
jgi:DmsE family decaheme c-type cytochrome